MKIRIGLVAGGVGWENLCLEEGVPYQLVNAGIPLSNESCSLLVVNRPLNAGERKNVEGFLSTGGAILGSAHVLDGVAGTASRKEWLEYIVPDNEAIFDGVSLLDLGLEGSIPREANAFRTPSNAFAVFAGTLRGGFAVILPFDVEALLGDTRIADKSFYASPDRLPSERVSSVGKGELRHLIHRAFEYLHHVRGIPYVHFWYFPADRQTTLAFRIDTDGARRADIDALYRIGRESNVPMTWFLDVKSHEDWLTHFAFMADHEMGVHCYEHLVYPDVASNFANIERAMRLMEVAGVTAVGFAAPYGIWNAGLAEAIDKAGFVYSSEFSLAYDTFPCYPLREERAFRTLQIPIHPICIGSLRKVGYSDRQMTDYFEGVIERKILRREPLFFYHHPSHQHWDVVRSLFHTARKNHVEGMTMGAYARWWERRLEFRFEATVETSNGTPAIRLSSEGVIDPDQWLRVSTPDGRERIMPFATTLELSTGSWENRPVFRPPADIRRIREFDPRKVLGDVFERMVRRLR